MPIIDQYSLNIFTDGSSYQHPRRGGMGILYVWVNASGEECFESLDQAGVRQATNNRMELLAIVKALENTGPFLEKRNFSKILVHTDSQYVARNYKTAMFQWSTNKWCNRWGRPVANAIEWKDFIRAVQRIRMRVDINWIPAKKHPYAKVVDKKAKASANQPSEPARSVVSVRRKISPETTDASAVVVNGQRATIRIITSEYLQIHRTNKYRYEVMTKKNIYYQKVSFLYSKELLKPGHIYYVQFNREKNNPGLLRVFRELNRKQE